MSFINDVVIYQSKDTRVYINQCFNKGKKTNSYAVRRDDKTGVAHFIGEIKFDGGWRQYVFFPEPHTKWSAGCKEAIAQFERRITGEWREKIKLRKYDKNI